MHIGLMSHGGIQMEPVGSNKETMVGVNEINRCNA